MNTAPSQTGNSQTHQKARQRLRNRLRQAGATEEEIERQVRELRVQQGRPQVPTKEESRAERAERRRDTKKLIQRDKQLAAQQAERDRLRWERERQKREDETYARLSPSDSGYRPSKPDPVTTGAARATGIAAKAARRGTTVTKWQHDDHEAKS